MQPDKFPLRERKTLIVCAMLFVVLGVSALLRDGEVTPAFWVFLALTNVAGLLAAFGSRPHDRLLRGIVGNPAKRLLVVLVVALLLRFGPFVQTIGVEEILFLRGVLLLGVNRNAAVGPMQRTLLGKAVDRKQREVVQLLLDFGADPNRADRHGWTPLMIARYRGDEEMAALLLQYGATDRPLPVLPKKKR
jgi:hypothetical protein